MVCHMLEFDDDADTRRGVAYLLAELLAGADGQVAARSDSNGPTVHRHLRTPTGVPAAILTAS